MPVEVRSDTPERILAAAYEVFSEKGYHQATVDEIAQRAGVSKAAVYLYHPSKQALFLTILRGRLERLRTLFDGGRLTDRRTPLEDMRSTAHSLVSSALAPMRDDRSWLPLYLEYLTAALRGDDQARQGLQSLYGEVRARVRRLLEDLAAAGVVRPDLQPEAAAAAVVAVFDGLTLQASVEPDAFPFERLVGLLVDLILDWFLPKE